MDGYIKRSDAMDAFTYEQGNRIPEVGSHGEQNEIWVRDVKAKLRSIRAADVVEVVRCRECKHFNLETHECENELISTDHEGGASYSLNFYDDDFCSYGER